MYIISSKTMMNLILIVMMNPTRIKWNFYRVIVPIVLFKNLFFAFKNLNDNIDTDITKEIYLFKIKLFWVLTSKVFIYLFALFYSRSPPFIVDLCVIDKLYRNILTKRHNFDLSGLNWLILWEIKIQIYKFNKMYFSLVFKSFLSYVQVW